MSGADGALVRIDSRLVHGQVVAAWVRALGARRIVVANDEAAGNPMRQRVMRMAVPQGVEVLFETVPEAAGTLRALGGGPTLAVVETPADALALVEAGVRPTAVNVGNLHMAAGKRRVAPAVAVDDGDRAALRALRERGVEVVVRRTPLAPEGSLDWL